MTYHVFYQDGKEHTFLLAEELTLNNAVISALLCAQAYEAGELYVEDEQGSVLFRCYPDGDEIRVTRMFAL